MVPWMGEGVPLCDSRLCLSSSSARATDRARDCRGFVCCVCVCVCVRPRRGGVVVHYMCVSVPGDESLVCLPVCVDSVCA